MKKITIVNPRIELVTGFFLARLLQERYEVEIVGFRNGGKNDFEFSKNEFPLKTVKGGDFPGFGISALKMLKKIECDLIYGVQLHTASYGVSLLKKKLSGKPLFVHVDDWILGSFMSRDGTPPPPKAMRPQSDPEAYPYIRLMERLVKNADEITVPNHQLRERFGGTVIYHGVDTEVYDPAKFDRQGCRERFGIGDEKVIMFVGNPRPHKGIEELLLALKKIGDPGIKLIVAGTDNRDGPFMKKLRSLGKEYLVLKPPYGRYITSEEEASYLAAADMVVLPQLDTPFARHQLSMKIFPAMAMEKPIIASSISDFPMVLKGCGIFVEPRDVDGLAEKIRYLSDNESLGRELGKKVRKRAVGKYSHRALRKILYGILDNYI